MQVPNSDWKLHHTVQVFFSITESTAHKPVDTSMEFTGETCILVNQGWLYQCMER